MQTSTEIEVKFPVSALGGVRKHLQDCGAHLRTPRHLERNWRLDRPDGALTASGRVLRVRQDTAVTLTFKAPTSRAMTREEFEVEVSSMERALQILEGLDFRVILTYEKYREVYDLEQVGVMLDELPYGCFVEIEGPDTTSLSQAAARIGLAWDAGVDLSYAEIFQQLRYAAGVDIPNLTFSDFDHHPLDALSLLSLQDALVQGGNTD
jgi:adenylate cyclase class 2